jgi:CHAT domain-containing protein/tetratricopeptide (TPR) repeat protein
LDLSAGEMVRITALQDGLDVALRWFPPGEEKPSLLIDSPTGKEGTESLMAVAAVGGAHRLEIQAAKDAKASGHYVVKLEEQRLATDEDRRKADLVARFAAGETLRRGNDSEGALAAYQELLPVARDLEDRSCEATLLYRVGWMQANLSRWDRSFEPFEQAISLFGSLGDHFMEATALNRCGDAYRTQFRVAEAQAAHQRALDLFRGEQDAEGTVQALVSLGTDQFEVGALDEAVATLTQARDLAERFDLSDQEVLARSKLGELLASRGDLVQARIELEAAVDRATAIGRDDLASLTLLPLGGIDLRENRLAEAKERYSHALEVFRTLQQPRNAIAARLGLGAALLRAGELEPAREQFEKARKVAREFHALDSEAVSAMNLGRYHYARGEDALSVSEHEQAIALFERLGDQAGIAANRFGAARSLCHDGQLEAALRQIDESLQGIENLRSATANYDLRTTQLTGKRDYAELQVEILMRLFDKNPASSYGDRALAATEKARARQLVDLLVEGRSTEGRTAVGPIADEEARIGEEIEGFEQRRRNLYQQETDSAVFDRLNAEEGRLLTRLEQLKAEARRADPRYAQIEPAETLDAAGMEKQLQTGEALLIYWLGEPRSFLWVVAKGRRESFVLPPRSKIEPLAQQFVKLLSSFDPHDAEQGREVGRALAAQILAPASRALATTRWIVVADGVLQRVPFAALPNPASPAGTPVLERVEIVEIPSATVLEALRSGARRTYSLDSLAVFADPSFAGDGRSRGSLQALPKTRSEAEAITELAGAQRRVAVAFGVDANRDAVLGSKLKGFKVIHFATHGTIHPAHPELSGLELAQLDAEGHRIEGTLRLQDIYGMGLNAELVVLSACNTGVGPDVAGEGLASLARGFFYAGAPRLVVSLWPVDDASTAELMRLFYSRLLRQNQAPALALREAQREIRRSSKYSDPYYWAGFVFIGDWRTDPERWQGPIETKDVGGSPPVGHPPIDLPVPPPAEAKVEEEGSRQGGGLP